MTIWISSNNAEQHFMKIFNENIGRKDYISKLYIKLLRPFLRVYRTNGILTQYNVKIIDYYIATSNILNAIESTENDLTLGNRGWYMFKKIIDAVHRGLTEIANVKVIKHDDKTIYRIFPRN